MYHYQCPNTKNIWQSILYLYLCLATVAVCDSGRHKNGEGDKARNQPIGTTTTQNSGIMSNQTQPFSIGNSVVSVVTSESEEEISSEEEITPKWLTSIEPF